MAKRKAPDPLAGMLEGLSPQQLKELAERVIDLAAYDRRRTPVSRRRPRQKTPTALTVRVDLVDAKPPIWRRVQVPSTLRLDQVHDLAQALFGWTDSHLHRFALGDSVWGHDGELFLCPYDVDEGEDEGVPASAVRLDEVLAAADDRLLYVYDYGDEWTLTLTVEAVTQATSVEPRVLDGRGIAPPDDSGGIHVWNEDRDDAPADLASIQGDVETSAREWVLPAPLVQVLRRVRHYPSYDALEALVQEADFAAGPPSADEATEVLRPYSWLLDRVGDGITLTQAGYLPPRDVEAATTELGFAADWLGKGNREDSTPPVAELRRSGQRLGLLRVSKGRLLPTKAGTAARTDRVLLAMTVAEKAGGLRRTALQRELTTLVLLLVAAGRSPKDDGSRRLVVQVLGDLGWSQPGGGPISPWSVLHVDEDTEALVDVLTGSWRSRTPTPAGRSVARLVLHHLT